MWPGCKSGENDAMTADDIEQKRQMREYVVRQVLTRSPTTIENDTALVSSGLLDSFSLLDVVHKLEELTERRIPPGKMRITDLDTIDRMFDVAARIGKNVA
jgi:acyl carrier protein